jgi:hypothetical protein
MPSQNLEMIDISTRMAIAFTSRPLEYSQPYLKRGPFEMRVYLRFRLRLNSKLAADRLECHRPTQSPVSRLYDH